MNDNWTYLREDPAATTTLASNLTLTRNTISVVNSSLLYTPNPALNIPGVVYINGERITYYTKDDGTNTLGQLRRGTLGTGANVHYAGDTVINASINQIIPDSYNMANTFTSNANLQTASGIYRDFYAGQTYIQSNLWLNAGNGIGSNVTDGTGLYGSTRIQALFVKKEVGA